MQDPELNLPFDEQQSVEQDQPVTVLGMTFPNDTARREYFREQLRAKLPELRKIEGFPIGKDDDIIALSDPPYYTACPNPWLNDFIAEWEQEKRQLVAEGKRDEDKVVTEPYASDVSVGKNNPVYTAHTYHTKVPHPAIMRYILHYTEPGDIVFDGFAGTGMTGVAAQACMNPSAEQRTAIESEWKNLYGGIPKWGQRHAICGDLSPYASMISYNYNTPVSAKLLKREVERIFKEVKDECEWMYSTEHEGKTATINYVVWSDVCICPHCGNDYVYWDAAIDYQNKCIQDEFCCPHCGAKLTKKQLEKRFITQYEPKLDKIISEVKSVPVIVVLTTKDKKRIERRPNEKDMELLQRIETESCKYFYPVGHLQSGFNLDQPQRSHHINYYFQFYTKRNLIALATLYDKIKNSTIPNKVKFIFTGMINRSTKMNRVHVNNYFYGGGGWNAGHLKGTLYIPNVPVETSILEQIEDKLNGYLRAIPMLPQEYDNGLYVGSAECVPISSNSIDYLFVDPPFGANIMYSELNTLPESWLNIFTNNKTEAIENPGQDKDGAFYLSEMQKCFMEFYRILKPGKWMTIEFSNTSASVWNSIQRAISKAGFVIANVAALDKKQGGMRSITTSTAVRQDLAISCYKPSVDFLVQVETKGHIDPWEFVAEHIEHLPIHLSLGKSTTAVVERSPKILYDRLISFFVEKGMPIPIDAQDFQAGLRERYLERDGMFFTAQQAAEYEQKRRTTADFVPMGLLVGGEADGIAWLQRELETPQTYQELQPKWMQALTKQKKGDKQIEMMTLLEENFIQESDGKWRLPDPEEEADREKLRVKGLMREFAVYQETIKKPQAKIKTARLAALQEGFRQCYQKKDWETIIAIGNKIPEEMLQEDEVLLRFYDIAMRHK